MPITVSIHLRHRKITEVGRCQPVGIHETGAASHQADKGEQFSALYPLWDLEPGHFHDTSAVELTQTALSVRANQDFMSALTRAVASVEPVYATSEHVELQIYGGKFFPDDDLELCRQFHTRPWERRLEIVGRFSDQRLKRLGRRLIYFETPHLIDDADRRGIADDISARRRGEGDYASPPWTTIAQAMSELDTIDAEVSAEFKRGFLELR